MNDIRDKLATKQADMYFNYRVEEDEWQHEYETFCMGWDAAVKELSKTWVEQCADVLDDAAGMAVGLSDGRPD